MARTGVAFEASAECRRNTQPPCAVEWYSSKPLMLAPLWATAVIARLSLSLGSLTQVETAKLW